MAEQTTEPQDDTLARDAGAEEAKNTPSRAGRIPGLVVALAPDYFEVYADGSIYLCTARNRLRKPPRTVPLRRGAAPTGAATPAGAAALAEPQRPTRIVTGDHTLITILSPKEGVVEEILPRRNGLSRMRSELGTEQVLIANVDLAALVFAIREPEPRLDLLDRYLALCEQNEIAALIIFNKTDLGMDDAITAAVNIYSGLGYPTLLTSAREGVGLDDLRARLVGKTSLLTGPSGVGKSSLMNALLPDAAQRIGAVSEATGQGRPPTTGARLLPLPEGGWLADSAGIRELALWNAAPDALAKLFVELRPIADDCEYEDCGHADGEEGCALRAALAEGRIAPARWASFERLLIEARERERPAWATATRR